MFFKRVLIANRGEIAVRVIRCCRKLDIESVAVFSDADRDSLHVRLADRAERIGSPQPLDSYLNIDAIIGVSKKTECEAIHPGYGFLAENPVFIERCEEEGLVFIGPSSKSIRKLENKLTARKSMADAGVPVIPGSTKPAVSRDEAISLANELGFPILLKAVFGGGGRGLRLARTVSDVERYFETAKGEAEAAFGQPEIYLEKMIPDARHVEVQVLADGKHDFVHLGERDCTIQRRHQKLLEESPSPVVDEQTRSRLCQAAVRGLAAAGYLNAGTVEFLLDKNRRFYFLEVNKRLQVEHLVTELVTGIDIVEEQLRIASDQEIPFSQDELRITGWAINCRINAEDPYRDFAPSPGTVRRLVMPGGPGIRIDTALYSGFTVPVHYDSLVAKVAAWGRDRIDAITRMRTALEELVTEGLQTTADLHKSILSSEKFRQAAFSTSFLEESGLLKGLKRPTTPQEVAAIAATMLLSPQRKTTQKPTSSWRHSTGPETGALQERRAFFIEGI